MRAFWLFILLCLIWGTGCHNNNPSDLTASVKHSVSALAQLNLKTLNNKDTLLNGIANNRATVFIFLSPTCPLSQSYSLPLNQLNGQYKKNNISFLGIFPGTQYSLDDFKNFQKKYSIAFPLLCDTAYSLTRILGASVTPEVFVVNNEGKTVYSGRIDNWAFEVGKMRQQATEHELQDALESIIANAPVKVSQTKAVGCFIETKNK